jgi:hypothetical protein
VEEVEVCSATAADDDDALALRIEMVDVEDDDAAAALQIAVNNVMVSMRDGFIVFILFGGRVYKAICLLMERLSRHRHGDLLFSLSSFYPR